MLGMNGQTAYYNLCMNGVKQMIEVRYIGDGRRKTDIGIKLYQVIQFKQSGLNISVSKSIITKDVDKTIKEQINARV